MKLMLNGAITLGTLDGANVEIGERVGKDNILIFGMTAERAADLKAAGYNPAEYYNRDQRLRRAIDLLASGLAGQQFPTIANSLRYDDPYMVLADFDAYCGIQQEASRLYQDTARWQEMSLHNIAGVRLFLRRPRDRGVRARHLVALSAFRAPAFHVIRVRLSKIFWQPDSNLYRS